jgi:multimeric flavodoxin WrbA
VEEELREKGHETERINLIEKDIGYCLACYHCRGIPNEPGCVQDDDALGVFDSMMNSDAIIYAAPLHAWSIAAPLKTFVERTICLFLNAGTPEHKSLIDDKLMSLLLTCAGPVENNADLVPIVFKRIVAYSKAQPAGELIVPFCTTPDAMGDDIKGQAQALANKIIESV